jgi:hypothetical protein
MKTFIIFIYCVLSACAFSEWECTIQSTNEDYKISFENNIVNLESSLGKHTNELVSQLKSLTNESNTPKDLLIDQKYLSKTALENAHLCFKSKSNTTIGCSYSASAKFKKSFKLASIRKVEFANYLLTKEEKKITKTELSLNVYGVTDDKGVCHLSGNGYPTVNLESAKSTLCPSSKNICLEKNFIYNEDSCSKEYAKLKDNAENDQILENLYRCLHKKNENFLCAVTQKNSKNIKSNNFRYGFKVKDVLKEMLVKSDSFLAQKIGEITYDNGTLHHSFLDNSNDSTSSTFASYLSDKYNCETVLNWDILENKSFMPGFNDTISTWHSFINPRKTEKSLMGKTGSAPQAGIINFLGSTNEFKFGIFYQFSQLGTTQDQLTRPRKVIYNSLWSKITYKGSTLVKVIDRLAEKQ